MTDFIRDIRFVARTLLRAPLFAALAVVTLAVGIGGTTALFSLVDAVVLRALPFEDPDRLVEIFGQDSTRGGMRVPAPIVEALRERSKTIAAIAIHGPAAGVMRAAEGPIDIAGNRVSANFTDVMGVPPLIGRGFLPDDDRPGAPAVMLVSFNFWQRHLGGDPAAVGRTLYLDTIPFTVVGVMPPEFRTDSQASRCGGRERLSSRRPRGFDESVSRLADAVDTRARLHLHRHASVDPCGDPQSSARPAACT